MVIQQGFLVLVFVVTPFPWMMLFSPVKIQFIVVFIFISILSSPGNILLITVFIFIFVLFWVWVMILFVGAMLVCARLLFRGVFIPLSLFLVAESAKPSSAPTFLVIFAWWSYIVYECAFRPVASISIVVEVAILCESSAITFVPALIIISFKWTTIII